MNVDKQSVLIVGLGYFGKELLRTLSTEWDVIVIDVSETRIARFKEEVPEARYHHGAGESTLTWKKLDLGNVKYIISALRDTEVDLEVCRIARTVHKLKIPIIVLVYEEVEEKRFEPYNVTLMNPLKLGIQMILKNMVKNVITAANVGLGKGELIEVSIKARSHLVGRKLKHLKPSRWHISALYRNGKLILPDGNCCMKIGDRVLLVGDPKVLENVSTTLLKGLPQFPMQYGSDIVFPLHVDYGNHLDEAIYWLDNFKAQRIRFMPFRNKLSPTFTEKIKKEVKTFEMAPAIDLYKEVFLQSGDTGALVVPVDKGRLTRRRIRETFKQSRAPFLISRLTVPYEGVVISLNGPDPVQAMEVGVETARMLGISLQVVYVTLPKEMRGREEDEQLRLRREIVTDFEAIHKTTVDYSVLEGNPVRRTLKYLAPLSRRLLILVSDPNASLSFFRPNVSYMIARKTRLSTLVIPEVYTHE